MSLQTAHDLLGWPEPECILNPRGAGPAALVQQARQKLERAIRRIPGCSRSKIGLLSPNPETKASEAPMAVVVEFTRPASDEALRETHRLAWNYARTPLLITLDPVLIRSWSCCEPPRLKGELFDKAEISDARFDLREGGQVSPHLGHTLSWLSLVSGDFFRQPKRSRYFDRNKAADRVLLDHLKQTRRQLHNGDTRTDRPPLDHDTIHDLLARVMFLQFLADRRDSNGQAALNADFLEQRQQDGTLARSYTDFSEVLHSKPDTYRLFRWLNQKFNGDLFPGEAERKVEERRVHPKHLRYLADFLRGDVEFRSGPRLLWKAYSFDVIPLDFISSIYEEFVRTAEADVPTGVVYTQACKHGQAVSIMVIHP